jgi:MFS family permease
MTTRFTRFGLVAAAVVAAGVSVGSTSAQADWRNRHRGGDVAAGLIGGLALGAIAGGAIAAGSRPAYGYGYLPPPPPRYRPAPVYFEGPRYYDERPTYCEIRRQKVWLDSWTYEVRRVRVCN